ncbi:MAG: RNA polymerase factor sigma-54 [Lachnospiraceae bacterium]|nr:RNA polymerase factor sigma-54 [Lachnospiraceae bacterium]
METRLEQSQKQILSQNLIQSVEILQMSAEELTEHIKEMALENPVAELKEPSPEDRQQDLLRKLEWLENLDEQNRTYYRYDREDSDRDYISNIGAPVRETLKDTLMQQLIRGPYTEEQFRIFSYIADCLDSSGFFRMSVQDAAAQLHVPQLDVAKCLEIMRALEPAGVCCADLESCLLEQLRRIQQQEDAEPFDVEMSIIREYMPLLGKNQLHTIAKKMKLPISRIKEAQLRIRSLNPRPAQGFDMGEMLRYIVPDVTVVKFKDRFEILLNNYSYPTIRMNRDYLKMLKDNPTPEVRDYLTGKVNQIRQMQEHIERRGSTLLALADCILAEQTEFFRKGEKYLKPLRMKDAADRIGIHESTVSRAVKDKYLQCCWGIYPLSFFFARSVSQEGDDSIATHQIKEEIRKIIEEEDKTHPLNDDRIACMLKERGMSISRRTVVKYRESMQIPNYRERKEF